MGNATATAKSNTIATAPNSAPKLNVVGGSGQWVGFDVDECIGHYITLIPYFLHINDISDRRLEEVGISYTTIVTQFAQTLVTSIKNKVDIKLFRPEIMDVFILCAVLKQRGLIDGVFFLSNNSVQLMLDVLAEVVNRLCGTLLIQNVFSRSSDCRVGTPEGMKSRNVVKRCISQIKTGTDVGLILFFDDTIHKMREEKDVIYVQVRQFTKNVNQPALHADMVATIDRLFGRTPLFPAIRKSVIGELQQLRADPEFYATQSARWVINNTEFVIGFTVLMHTIAARHLAGAGLATTCAAILDDRSLSLRDKTRAIKRAEPTLLPYIYRPVVNNNYFKNTRRKSNTHRESKT